MSDGILEGLEPLDHSEAEASVLLDRRGFIVLGIAATLALPAEAASTGNRIVNLTNSARRRKGLAPLRRNGQLETAAVRYARVMASRGRLSHSVDGSKLADRLSAARYDFRNAAENIAYHPAMAPDELAANLMRGWLQSRGHARNILDPKMREIGTGLAKGGTRVYAVQLFGARR